MIFLEEFSFNIQLVEVYLFIFFQQMGDPTALKKETRTN